ncbi:glutathione reductase [Caenispirillum salinarum AK4]|uniref:Glutathione reductase n=1 Tax=Caenispirillum salinarum AK4 TaxID=1238182 RepID=K9H0E1_9PROT|nr:NAD(P)/FAD-dependent oxidoreductase [Caenispirillum salinarum]EKV31660.1 glutathione reductase [Caenispirillum salinarum AK4]
MSAPDYDLLVIGTGSGARGVAKPCAQAGWRVAVVDRRPYGGTCAQRGCDPKKVMVGIARAVDDAARLQGHGVDGALRLDWSALMAFKQSFVDSVPKGVEAGFRKAGIDTLHGAARFTGPTSMRIDDREVSARHIVLATGAVPAPLPIPGADLMRSSDDFLDLGHLPARVVFVGGGYIAAEFACIAARAGAAVTVVQRGPRMLKGFDPDLVAILMERFRALGIDVRTDSQVTGIEQHKDGYRVTLDHKEEGASTVKADLVVHAAGRVAQVADLDLQAAGVAAEKGRLTLDRTLRSTTNPAVWAVGDAAQKGPPLTPVASHDARVVVANLLEDAGAGPDYRAVPTVAFSLPPIASVGLTAAEARARVKPVRQSCGFAADWFTARHNAERAYGYKVLIEEGTERVLGAHLVGPHADEVINVFALAIRQGLTTSDLKDVMFAYPTTSSDIHSML